MIAIVNVNEKWGIGKDGHLLCDLKEDMKFFRTVTAGKIIICGLNTLLSFPGQKPLRGRVNIVIADDMNKIPTSAKIVSTYYIEHFGNKDEIHIIENWIDRVIKDNNSTYMIVINSLEYAKKIADYIIQTKRHLDEAYVCGGASIYRQLIGDCDTALVTKNNCEIEPDVYFPNLDEDPDWYIEKESEEMTSESGLKYKFLTYKNSKFNS